MTTVNFQAPLNSRRQHPADKLRAGVETKVKFTVTERDGITAVDLTGLTPKLRAKVDHQDADFLFDVAGVVTDAEDGLCEVDLPAPTIPDPRELYAELNLFSGAVLTGQVGFFLPVLRGAS